MRQLFFHKNKRVGWEPFGVECHQPLRLIIERADREFCSNFRLDLGLYMIELGGAMKTPILILLVLFSVLLAQHKVQHKMMTEEEQSGHHRFDDAEKWAGVFEDSTRDEWQLPDEVIESLDIGKEDVIADIGSATGYFPVRFARTASSGHVYGIDIEPNQVDYLNARAKRDKLPNLESVLGEANDPKIPEKVDLVFICNTYHHILHRGDYFENLKQYLKPNGRLAIVDFRKGELPVGPQEEMKLSKETVIEELTAAGYRQLSNSAKLPYQYVLVFQLR